VCVGVVWGVVPSDAGGGSLISVVISGGNKLHARGRSACKSGSSWAHQDHQKLTI
jgi:hypothetical protein